VCTAFCGKMSSSCRPYTETRTEKDVNMDSGNGSIPKRRQDRGHSVRNWPCAASFRGDREKLSLDHLDPHQKQRIIIVLRQYALSIVLLCCVGLLFCLTLYVPYWLPGWYFIASRWVTAHLLFVGALSIILVFFLLWKFPQRHVSIISELKDRIDLSWKV